METVFSMWFVPKCYKQGQSISGIKVVGRAVKSSGVKHLGGDREFSWQFS
jgi:hypothetical protein